MKMDEITWHCKWSCAKKPQQVQAQETYKLSDQGFPTCENFPSGHKPQLRNTLCAVNLSVNPHVQHSPMAMLGSYCIATILRPQFTWSFFKWVKGIARTDYALRSSSRYTIL